MMIAFVVVKEFRLQNIKMRILTERGKFLNVNRVIYQNAHKIKYKFESKNIYTQYDKEKIVEYSHCAFLFRKKRFYSVKLSPITLFLYFYQKQIYL